MCINFLQMFTHVHQNPCAEFSCTLRSHSSVFVETRFLFVQTQMSGDKEHHSKKKSKVAIDEPMQRTSDDILASLFNDLESTGQVG
jgi:hypothetical protein